MASRGPSGTIAMVLNVLLMLVLAPLFLVVFLVLLAFWLVATLTGIGPLVHYFCSKADDKRLRSIVEPAPGAQLRLTPVSGGRHRLAVRWTPGNGSRPYQVCIPNGLGATLVTISKLHEALADLGFGVLSYDRAGVGLSDKRSPPPGAPRAYASAAEVVTEMKEVMDGVAPDARWLLVGPSMGNIVAQCYVTTHPDRIAGILNVDGFPFPFAAKRRSFELSGHVYSVVAFIARTGGLRPLMGAAAGQLTNLDSRAFGPEIVLAQMNQASFYSSLAAEMLTMMDLADTARAAWGPAFDLVTIPKVQLAALANAAPAACGDVVFATGGGSGAGGAGADAADGDGDKGAEGSPGAGGGDDHGDGKKLKSSWTWEELPRSADELGGVDAPWTPIGEVRAVALDPMLSAHNAAAAAAAAAAKVDGGNAPAAPPLPGVWQRLAVRAISGRNYEKLGAVGGAFYDVQMREWGAAEHSLHVQLAARGARTVFPTRSHTEMLLGIEPWVAKEVERLEEDATAVAARSGSP